MTSSHFYYLAVAHVVFSACLVCYNVQNIPPRCRPRESDESAGGKAIVIFLSLFVDLFYSFLVWLMSFNFVLPFTTLPSITLRWKKKKRIA